MRFLFGLAFLFALNLIEARPPLQQQGRGGPLQKETNDSSDWNLGLEYNRYLQEVVQVLESDPEFRKKLETADVEKIRDGSIANELEMVNHQIRSQLDVIKRKELERLRHLAMRQYEMQNGIDKRHIKIPQHIEIQNPTFEIDDLRRLIKTTTKDLEEADRKRRTEFKRYEMEKKFEHEQRLQHIEDEEKRKMEEHRMEEEEKKHREHSKVNHPMTKDQLEGVWEDQDHMRAQDWDPKTFFAMHDLNGDRFWDEDEVRVLFKKELDKVYDPNAPEDDMREREEEMERMREHVFRESDTDKNRLISFDEFLAETKREEFEKDPGWETMDQSQDTPFTDEEFKAYEMQRMREIQGMINRGVVPDGYPYYGGVPPGAPIHPQLGLPGQQAYMQGHQNMPVHPGQMPNQFQPGQGQGMNVQPLRGEQNYRQPAPQFAGAQPQQQFGQAQQFGQQKQQFGGQQQQQFAGQQQQQFAGQQQQQFGGQKQQFDRGQAQQVPQQQQQFAAPPQQQQQFAAPQQQQQQQQPLSAVKQQPADNLSQVEGGQAPPPQQQQPAAEKTQEIQQPQPRGQPVIRAQKPSDGQPQEQQNP